MWVIIFEMISSRILRYFLPTSHHSPPPHPAGSPWPIPRSRFLPFYHGLKSRAWHTCRPVETYDACKVSHSTKLSTCTQKDCLVIPMTQRMQSTSGSLLISTSSPMSQRCPGEDQGRSETRWLRDAPELPAFASKDSNEQGWNNV